MEDGGADSSPEEQEDGEERDVREPRHGDDEPCNATRGRQRRPHDEQPDQAAHPDRAGCKMEPVEQHREAARRRLPGVPDRARKHERRGRRREGAAEREHRRDRTALPPGAVDPDRDRRRDAEQREADLDVDVAAARRRRPPKRDDAADVEERPKRVDRGRLLEIHGNGDEAERGRDPERDRDPAQARTFDTTDERLQDQRSAARTVRSQSSRSRMRATSRSQAASRLPSLRCAELRTEARGPGRDRRRT